MKNYITHDPWCIIEEGWHPEYNQITESLMSLGNGRMGQRGNFEEQFTGHTLAGSYVAGVYYPDKTRVGWWKNGYPEYFAKVLNACNWIGIHISIDGEILDLNQAASVEGFRRVLNMKDGTLSRTCAVTMKSGRKVQIDSIRFCSMADDEAGVVKYSITPLNFSGNITFLSFADADIKNADSNYDEKFWDRVYEESVQNRAFVTARTKKTGFEVCTGVDSRLFENNRPLQATMKEVVREKYAGCELLVNAKENQCYTLYKYAANLSSMHYSKESLLAETRKYLDTITAKGFETLLMEQQHAWERRWKGSDITIEGDIAAQQGIRFNIFQLHQTYTGEDERLNIGPKGFTGEKYGGSTYWDTEAYCIPFYLSNAEPKVSRQLLLYRYRQLGKAIENAAKLGFSNGAALYPMVTMNGEECHNEWEITFEEIHRNGAIAYAIANYISYTGDEQYLEEAGLEVLIGIARFWSQRITWSEARQKFVMLGVTGPNEYENNVNNNWYTNYIAVWCLRYAAECINKVKASAPEAFARIQQTTGLKAAEETGFWKKIEENMYFPYDVKMDIILQQDGYMDKVQILVHDLPASERPLNQKWSWDRILRSCFIKQADVLQGIYFFEENFDLPAIERNFRFYEPRTVHESSLSPCVHNILACRIGDREKAYEMYLRTSRLDLDDYNNDTEDGCHITSMAGTWMSIVQGFAGMRVKNGALSFRPYTPEQWKSYSFTIRFRGGILKIAVSEAGIDVVNTGATGIAFKIYDEVVTLDPGASKTLPLTPKTKD